MDVGLGDNNGKYLELNKLMEVAWGSYVMGLVTFGVGVDIIKMKSCFESQSC